MENPNKHNKTVLITGASTGIGREFARRFAQDGYDLAVVARSKGKLESLKSELEEKFGVKVEVFAKDLSTQNSADDLMDEVRKSNLKIDILINNAGFGLNGAFLETDIQREAQMINLNILTLVKLTKFFAQDMKNRKVKGKILNVASTAAFQPGPYMSIYYASKSFVLSFSEAIREELKPHGIQISTLCPGMTKTEFAKNAKFGDADLFNKFAMSAEKCVGIGYKKFMNDKGVIITGAQNNLMAFMNRILPRSIVSKSLAKLQNSRKSS